MLINETFIHGGVLFVLTAYFNQSNESITRYYVHELKKIQ